MGILQKLGIVEEIPNEQDFLSTYEEISPIEETINVEYNAESGASAVVEDTYVQNGLHDMTRSIFKVEELMNSLPKEMVTETKKSSVLAILNSFNLTATEVVADGENRITILNSVKEKINAEAENDITDKQNQIEEYKKAIAVLEGEISNKQIDTKVSNETIAIELNRIEELIKFIGGTY